MADGTPKITDVLEIINGTLLGDASIRIWKNKYYYYTLNAKDVNFLIWVKGLFLKFNIPTYIVLNNRRSGVYTLGFYINARNDPRLLSLREKWYKSINGKTQKIIPKDLELTPATMLFWYLGDGSLIRRNDPSRVPAVVLATNNLLKKDIDILLKKLKDLGLNFYPVKYKSGFTGKYCGYALWSKTRDETLFHFFKMIGFKPPKKIEKCFTGRKGKNRKVHYFKDKWPSKEDWIRILSNVKTIGKILKEERLSSGLSRLMVAKNVNCSKDYIKRIENCRRKPSVKVFKNLLEILNLSVEKIIRALSEKQ